MITLQERVHGHPPPDVWQLSKLHHVLKVRKGFKNAGMKEENLLSLSYGRIIPKDIDASEGLLPESFEAYQIVEPGNIVLRLTDLQNDKRSLRQGLVREQGIVTSAYDALQVTKGHDPRFWAYALLALDLAKYYYSLGGGVRQSIKFVDFPNDWLRAPDDETQKSIADFLDRETARIDHLIEKKQRMLELTKERHHALTERLVTFGPDSDVERVETGNLWMPFASKGAQLLPIKRIASLINGYAFSSDDLGDKGVPVLRIGDVGTSIDIEAAAKFTGDVPRSLSQFVVQRGDILIAMTGATIGKFGVYQSDELAYINQRVGILRATRVSSSLLSACLGTRCFVEQMKLFAYGGAQPNIGASEIGAIVLPVLPPEIQDVVAKIIDRENARLNFLREQVLNSIDRLREFRAALITAAVTGQIDVAAWGKRGRIQKHIDEIEAGPGRKEARA
nr:restriction endonuclease subunit S [Nitrosomonas nitrosa]